MTVKDRILAIIADQKITVREFERLCGFSNGYISKIADTIPSKKSAEILRVFPQISTQWLLYGEGAMLKKPVESNARFVGHPYAATDGDPGVEMVPFVSVRARASFIENLDHNPEIDAMEALLRPDERSLLDRLTIFEVEGPSMIPTIVPGSYILTERIPPQRWHYVQGVVIAIIPEFVLCKRITRNTLADTDALTLHSDNKSYGEMTIPLAEIRALYKARRTLSADIF